LGNFREDLFHRLSVIPIHVPSLDERKDDIPLLTEYFNQIISQEMGSAKKEIERDAVAELQNKNWPGNIRQFRNVIERLIILSGKAITANDVKQFA
jgi:DNA-binding NtrC family response regulator